MVYSSVSIKSILTHVAGKQGICHIGLYKIFLQSINVLCHQVTAVECPSPRVATIKSDVFPYRCFFFTVFKNTNIRMKNKCHICCSLT